MVKLLVINVSTETLATFGTICLLMLVGKTLAFTTVKFINKDNQIVARGSHTKFVALAHKDERNQVEQLEPSTDESKVGNPTGTA